MLEEFRKVLFRSVERSKGKVAGDEIRKGSRDQIMQGLTFTYFFSRYLLSSWYVPGALLGFGIEFIC